MSSSARDSKAKERAWVKRRIGYATDAIKREFDILLVRLVAIESMFPSGEPRTSPPGGEDASSSPVTHTDERGSDTLPCIACRNLSGQGVPETVVQQIHGLHLQDAA